MKNKQESFWQKHSLSIIAAAIVLALLLLYCFTDEHKHWGAFFGNAIADWTGVVVTVLGTKYLYEVGSKESEPPKVQWHGRLAQLCERHLLTITLLVTGVVWVALFAHMETDGKWGQVVGNIVSEWTQCLGLVLLSKRFFEKGKKGSK